MADNKKEDMTFEKKLSRMEEISKALSDPATDLQKAVSLYEEGMGLAKDVPRRYSSYLAPIFRVGMMYSSTNASVRSST